VGTSRLEAFSDGVLAIIITIMVLELKVPREADFDAVRDLWPELASYFVSFVYIAIYWNNHHHMIHAVKRVDARIMWANMHLLFWLSLVPVTTGWIDHNLGVAMPTAAYGVVLFMAGIAYLVLELAIVRHHPDIKYALGKNYKGKLSGFAYLAAVPLAYVSTWISITIYVGMAALWVIPDKRMEKVIELRETGSR
jgi:uncharacterized membrane protein